ncbi:GNAT family N-acetyltransferase [Paenibacillus larvae]
MHIQTQINGNKIEIIQAGSSDKSVIRNLMQLYQYESTDYSGDDPDQHGYFDYPYLDHYWTEEGQMEERRLPLLLKVNGNLAGFILINNHTVYLEQGEDTYTIAEFFVLKKWRKQGIGREAACQLFRRFKGTWEIREEGDNNPAHTFWRKVIHGFTQGNYKEVNSPGWDGPIQIFHVKN